MACPPPGARFNFILLVALTDFLDISKASGFSSQCAFFASAYILASYFLFGFKNERSISNVRAFSSVMLPRYQLSVPFS